MTLYFALAVLGMLPVLVVAEDRRPAHERLVDPFVHVRARAVKDVG
jgi:hypothetical protein